MTKPKVFIHVETEPQCRLFNDCEALAGFDITQSHAEWVEELVDLAPVLAIIESANISARDSDVLTQSGILNTTEFVFVSPGAPNPHLDVLVKKSAAVHLRTPIDPEFLQDFCRDLLQDLESESADSPAVNNSSLDQFGLLVGSSNVMKHLYRTLRRVARSTASVLVEGESGVGKELVANTIHLASARAEAPFVAINCGALSPDLIDSELFGHIKGAFTGAVRDHQGVFEQAQGGTLFLDEVTEMPLEHQVKLLRVLETGEYRPVGSQRLLRADVRILAATNRDPQRAIIEGHLREDLYFRLAHFPINVPPLREREGDILGLAEHFLAYRNAAEGGQLGFSESAKASIQAHSWPGNVRELKHVIERAAILADEMITEEHLVLENPPPNFEERLEVPTGTSLEEIEREAITQTLTENEGNKTQTAQQLGISVKTLYNKLDKYESLDS